MNTIERNYPFRERMAVVHRTDRRDFDKKCPNGFIEVTSDWCIAVPKDADVVMMNAARDLEDYFFTSMKISLQLKTLEDCTDCAKKIVYGIDASLEDYSYRFTVSENEISLVGKDSRMAAQAGYFLEDLMNLEEGPFTEKTEITRKSLFNPRMVHSGYGLDL